eukprot:m51a1_g14814 putative cbf nf-y family transcription (134) ;mRNA; f:609285-610113
MGDADDSGDLGLPRATVTKLIRDTLPEGTRCANDTRDLIQEAGLLFVKLLCSQANEIATKEGKKTITPVFLEKALQELGYGRYWAEVKTIDEKHKEERPRSTKKAASDVSTEELQRQQAEMFAKFAAQAGSLP